MDRSISHTSDEVFHFPLPELEALIFTDEPIELKSESAKILAQFQKTEWTLRLELAHIDGQGEGVLLVEKYAQLANLTEIHWIVHAVHCAKPNIRLRRMLIWKGFQLKELDEFGLVYFRNQTWGHTIEGSRFRETQLVQCLSSLIQ